MLDFLIHLWFVIGEGEIMTIDLSTIDDFLFSMTYASKKTELDKAKDIADQITSSIAWLKYQATKEQDLYKKSDILKEVTAAERELDRINLNITKTEKNNE